MGRQGKKKKKTDLCLDGGPATRPGGNQRNKRILEILFLELSEPKKKKKKDLHPLALTGRTGQTVLMAFPSPPLWLMALFWMFVKCSFLLVHVPRL